MSEEMTPTEREPSVDEQLAKELVARARSEGAQLVGPGALLSDLTKTVLETARAVEMEDHLGYAKHAPEDRDNGNSRNGTRSKTVLTEVGEVELDVPATATGRSSRGSSRSAWGSKTLSDRPIRRICSGIE